MIVVGAAALKHNGHKLRDSLCPQPLEKTSIPATHFIDAWRFTLPQYLRSKLPVSLQ